MRNEERSEERRKRANLAERVASLQLNVRRHDDQEDFRLHEDRQPIVALAHVCQHSRAELGCELRASSHGRRSMIEIR